MAPICCRSDRGRAGGRSSIGGASGAARRPLACAQLLRARARRRRPRGRAREADLAVASCAPSLGALGARAAAFAALGAGRRARRLRPGRPDGDLRARWSSPAPSACGGPAFGRCGAEAVAARLAASSPTSSPRSEWPRTSVIRTSTISPDQALPAPAKLTTRLHSVRPHQLVRRPCARGLRRSIRCTVPTRARADRVAVAPRSPPAAAAGARASRSAGVSSAQRRGRRAGARAEEEAEAVVEADVVDQLHRPLEVVVGLAREADDEVARDADVGPHRAQLADRALVFRARCSRASSPQDAVAAVLHRQMQVVDELGTCA